jgi:Peptidase MA superfamily
VRLQSSYGYTLPYRPALVFYNSSGEGDADLGRDSGVPFGDFVVGRAYPGTSGVVMLARADGAYLQRTITHELAHLFQYQLGPRVFDAPHWWIEGDAKAQEPTSSVERSLGYTRNIAYQQALPTLVNWDSRNYSNEASLDHVLMIGASFVTFLKTIYGGQAFATFYGNWRAGEDFNGAFVLTYGKTLDELDQEWKSWLLNNDSIVVVSSEEQTSVTVPAVMLAEIPEGMARVNAYWLNFRDGPGLDFQAVALLSIGQLLLPLGRDESGEWMLVELPDGTQGWLFSEYVDYTGSIDDLTVSLY